jgi:hypothetical protein
VEGSGRGPVLGSVQLLLDRRKNQFSSFAVLAEGYSSVRHRYEFLWRFLATHSIHVFPFHFPFAQTFANAQRSDYYHPGTHTHFVGPAAYKIFGAQCVCEKEYKIR